MATSMRAVRFSLKCYRFRSLNQPINVTSTRHLAREHLRTSTFNTIHCGKITPAYSLIDLNILNQRRTFTTHEHAHSERNCWKCGVSNRSYEELFFCKCGIVQKLPEDVTYFDLLDSDQTFDIDTEKLSVIYRHLQSKLHPDKFTLKSKEEQDLAEKQSAFINKAYFTLLKPLTRGLYLLEIWGDPLDESTNMVDQEFLLEMMEMNEDVDEARADLDELKTLEDINCTKMDSCIQEVSNYFKEKKISDAKLLLIKLKYLTNICEKIKDIHRSHMDHV